MPPFPEPGLEPLPAFGPALTGLDLQIASALQVDPRASWRRIAAVLDAPERSVTRHGAALLASGAVAVAGMPTKAETALLRIECTPGATRAAVESLAQRSEATFAYAVTGGADGVAELLLDRGRLRTVLIHEIAGTVGAVRVSAYPVLRYFRTIRKWHSGVLTPAQVDALTTEDGPEMASMGDAGPLTGLDAALARVLAEDGRATHQTLARRVDTSETTAARRVSALLSSARVQVRALVEPSVLGLPVEAILWIRAAPRSVTDLGLALAADPRVRYAAAVAGEHQIVANVTCRTNLELFELLTASGWVDLAESVETSLLLQARKRGGRLLAWRD